MPSERPPLLSFIVSWTSASKLNGVHSHTPTRRSNEDRLLLMGAKRTFAKKLMSAKGPISVLSDFWRVHMFSKFRVTRITTSRSHACAG